MARLPSSCFHVPLADRLGAPSTRGACGSRSVAITTTSSRNTAASIANSRVKDVALDVSTRCPPMRPPTPSPRFCRKNCVAKARDRVSEVEQSTIIVASAGCMTA